MFGSIAAQFNAGGDFMWIILAVFALAVAVMIERLIYFFIYCNNDTMKTASNLIAKLKSGNIKDAEQIASSRTTPMHKLMNVAVSSYSGGKEPEIIIERIEQAAIRELPRLSNRINYLSLIANVSTLLGLLGTITGLQLSFSALADDASQQAAMLAVGISKAMNTTAFGLIVAVPCMVMYTFLSNKQQKLVKTIDEAVSHIVSAIKEKKA
ncbi:biopolymer transport protein ExbB/TolQ [Chitinispirillum alkaliphilum]|nr:biopolymer transport protein ExbB/TolQ [Chitinispirillum alkaliphilum]